MSDVVLKAERLTKAFGGLRAVSDVSLEARLGEIHAVIGPNGAGKSTLINLLSGDLRVSSGAIAIDGVSVTHAGPDRRGRAGLGRSYQKTTIFPGWTALDNARLAAQGRSRRRLALFASARSLPGVDERAMSALDLVGLSGREHVIAGLLSHGEQRALETAMVLATDPRLILLDEPLAGMGQGEAQRMVALIASLKPGRAIIIVEHDMDAVFRLADRLTVMADGRIIASGAPAEVRDHPAVRAAYLGVDGVSP